MSRSTLRALIEDASKKIRTYRDPDISEAQARLNEVIGAAGFGCPGTDRIIYLGFSHGFLRVTTSYSVRSCERNDDFELPEAVVDAQDPIRAATLWGLEKRKAEAVREIARAEETLAEWKAKLAGIEAKLAAA